MAGISIEVHGSNSLSALAQQFDFLLDAIPVMRRELFTQISGMMQTKVNASIGSTVGGRVPGWQKRHVGSGGGYARYKADFTSTVANRNVTGGHITQFLEHGHVTRRALHLDRKGRRAIKSTPLKSGSGQSYVAGRYFYRAAKTPAIVESQQMALAYADRIAAMLKG